MSLISARRPRRAGAGCRGRPWSSVSPRFAQTHEAEPSPSLVKSLRSVATREASSPATVISRRPRDLHRAHAKVFVKDELSLNGVYVKLTPEQPVELQSGDVFRIGQEIIRFELLVPPQASPDGVERLGSPSKGYVGRISLLTGRDTTGNAYPVPEHGLHIGRERGDILFPEMGTSPVWHCLIGWIRTALTSHPRQLQRHLRAPLRGP